MTAVVADRPPHCGSCNEHTRLIELDDGSSARCPTCHPLRGIWPWPRTAEEADAANARAWLAAYGSPPPQETSAEEEP